MLVFGKNTCDVNAKCIHEDNAHMSSKLSLADFSRCFYGHLRVRKLYYSLHSLEVVEQ